MIRWKSSNNWIFLFLRTKHSSSNHHLHIIYSHTHINYCFRLEPFLDFQIIWISFQLMKSFKINKNSSLEHYSIANANYFVLFSLFIHLSKPLHREREREWEDEFYENKNLLWLPFLDQSKLTSYPLMMLHHSNTHI